MALNCEQVKQLFHLYDETAQRLNDIKDDLNKSIFHGREREESEYHYAVFRNMKNFIVSEINKVVTESNYQGFKEEDFMVPSEKLEEEKKFKQWERLAFEPSSLPNPNFTGIEKKGTISVEKRKDKEEYLKKDEVICSNCGCKRGLHRIPDRKCPLVSELTKDTFFSPMLNHYTDCSIAEWEKIINESKDFAVHESSELNKKEPPFPHYKSPDWNNYMVAFEKERKAANKAGHMTIKDEDFCFNCGHPFRLHRKLGGVAGRCPLYSENELKWSDDTAFFSILNFYSDSSALGSSAREEFEKKRLAASNSVIAYETSRNAEHEKAITARYEKLKHALDDSFGLIPPEEREESMNEKEAVKELEHETQSA